MVTYVCYLKCTTVQYQVVDNTFRINQMQGSEGVLGWVRSGGGGGGGGGGGEGGSSGGERCRCEAFDISCQNSQTYKFKLCLLMLQINVIFFVVALHTFLQA